MRKTLLTALVGLTVLAAAQTAEAQYGGYGGGGYGYGPPPPPPRWGYRHRIHGYVGAQLTGIGIVNQKTSNDMKEYLGGGGGGGGLFGGVRLGPFFSLELNWNITYHNVAEDYWGDVWSAFTLQTFELNGKIHIPTRGMIEPYIQLGIGGVIVGVSWDDRYSWDQGDYILSKGFTFNIGGGLDFWLSPFVSLGGRVLYKGMRFGESYDVHYRGGTTRVYANYASAINVDLNVALHF